MKDSKNKEQVTACMLMLMFLLLDFALIAVIIAAEIGSLSITLDVLFRNIFLAFIGEVCIAVFTVFLIVLARWFKSHPSFGILETRLNLIIYNKRRNLALKNTQQIAPPLQAFLWQILYRNKSLLGIDPGPDMRALSPNGWHTAYRNRAVYHVFELAMKNEPGLNEKILQQLINQFIIAELINYGIDGLAAWYGDRQAIYLDRLRYDDVRRVLIFDMLFVASDKAAAALTKALERDYPKAAAPEMDVYDDEL